MPRKCKDWTGLKTHRLKVIRRVENRVPRRPRWECLCSCGNTCYVSSDDLARGTQSCGCAFREYINGGCRPKRHGMTKTSIHRIWMAMRDRCSNINHTSYKHYGGRGITVCERWHPFENFYADMGDRPSKDYSIDRINVNGNYEPSNCRWATWSEQNLNRRPRELKNKDFVEFKGERLRLEEWAKRLGVSQCTIRRRRREGWPVEKIVTTPNQRKRER